MIPHKQLNGHDPANGIWGDCYRTAVASILELRPEDVPHVCEVGRTNTESNELMNQFLNRMGLCLIDVPFPGDLPLDDILAQIKQGSPDGTHYLLAGRSQAGVNHAVVCEGDRIVHDPSQNNNGIIGPCDDGLYWISFIGVRSPSALIPPAVLRNWQTGMALVKKGVQDMIEALARDYPSLRGCRSPDEMED